MLVFIFPLFAQEEQNGVQLTVTKKTTSRNDVRTGFLNEERINRTMALHVVVKNVSMNPFPEGEIDYSLLVLKTNFFPSMYVLYSGTEALPALKTGESAEVVIGAAQINGWREIGEQRKDKMDYKVIVKHGKTETAVVKSIDGFDAIAATARKMASNSTN
jgi:hypothetical protein